MMICHHFSTNIGIARCNYTSIYTKKTHYNIVGLNQIQNILITYFLIKHYFRFEQYVSSSLLQAQPLKYDVLGIKLKHSTFNVDFSYYCRQCRHLVYSRSPHYLTALQNHGLDQNHRAQNRVLGFDQSCHAQNRALDLG